MKQLLTFISFSLLISLQALAQDNKTSEPSATQKRPKTIVTKKKESQEANTQPKSARPKQIIKKGDGDKKNEKVVKAKKLDENAEEKIKAAAAADENEPDTTGHIAAPKVKMSAIDSLILKKKKKTKQENKTADKTKAKKTNEEESKKVSETAKLDEAKLKEEQLKKKLEAEKELKDFTVLGTQVNHQGLADNGGTLYSVRVVINTDTEIFIDSLYDKGLGMQAGYLLGVKDYDRMMGENDTMIINAYLPDVYRKFPSNTYAPNKLVGETYLVYKLRGKKRTKKVILPGQAIANKPKAEALKK